MFCAYTKISLIMKNIIIYMYRLIIKII